MAGRKIKELMPIKYPAWKCIWIFNNTETGDFASVKITDIETLL